MEEFKTIVTRLGLAKIANATALGEKVDLKYMAFGDGNGSTPEINEDMTELVNQQFIGEINHVEILDDNNIKITKIIPPHVGGFWIREIGVFDTNKDLIAIGTFPSTYKPNIEDGATKDIRTEMILTVSNVEAITLKIDPYVVTATLKDLDDLRNEVDAKIDDIDLSDIHDKIDEVDKQNTETKDQLDNHEKLIHEEENGRHGLKITEDKKLAFYDGYDWLEIEVEPEKIRDIGNVPLKVQVADKPPIAEEGRIYYDIEDKLFYVARANQWWRLFVGGDEKLEQDPPKDAPKLKEKTDTTVTLVETENMEYRYQGGSWQEDNHFAGLQRNETYHFEQRFKGDEVHKVSPPSPSLSVTTNKGEQTAPNKPAISNIQHNRATVKGETNTEVSLDKSTWYPSPHTFTGLKDKTGYTAYARRKETATHNASPVSSGASFTTPSRIPGSATLKKGTMQEGYFGSVPTSQLITGDELARKVGVTQGTAQHSTTPWHKFAYKNKILFVTQKTIRHSISWDHLNEKNVVYGNKTIEIDGVKYKVRLLKGALTDPSDYSASDRGAKGSEWNRLILPLHEERKNNSWGYKEYVEDDLQDWETYLSNSDMIVSSGDGKRSWCQEVGGDGSPYRVYRGYLGVSYSFTNTSSNTDSDYGWRPVLEVI